MACTCKVPATHNALLVAVESGRAPGDKYCSATRHKAGSDTPNDDQGQNHPRRRIHVRRSSGDFLLEHMLSFRTVGSGGGSFCHDRTAGIHGGIRRSRPFRFAKQATNWNRQKKALNQPWHCDKPGARVVTMDWHNENLRFLHAWLVPSVLSQSLLRCVCAHATRPRVLRFHLAI